jgi:hypothetical protein
VLNKSNIFLLCIALWFSQASIAQSRCGFDIVHNRAISQSPEYKKRIDDLEKIIREKTRTTPPRRGIQGQLGTAAALYTIPVVVHVIHTGGAIGSIYNPSDAQIMGAIDYLNSVFNGTIPGIEGVGDIQIQFELAHRDPSCNATTAINRVDGSVLANYAANGVNFETSGGASEPSVKDLVRWDPSKYYNIWVVNKIDGQDGTSGSFIGGYSYLPPASPQLDGTLILATQMATNRTTLAHELGHALSVLHPFQGQIPDGNGGYDCPVNSNCANDGDQVCDTDPVIQSYSCRTGTNSCTGGSYNINTEHNFMGYTNCATLFTAGQKARMLASASSSRNYEGSWALSPNYPVSPFNLPATASCTPATTGSGLTSNWAGVMNLTLNGISVNSLTSFIDGGYRNNSSSCQSLFYLEEGLSYNISLRLFGLNAEQARVWIDFNNDGIFNNAEEYLGGVNETSTPGPRPNGLTVNIPVVVPASAVKDQVIRMRVIDELSTIYGTAQLTNACISPQYGQAEDYPVFIRSLSLLPIELLSFTATPAGNDVQLNWQTSLEQNSAGFDIERSTNGNEYLKIGTVSVRGVPSAYRFTDRGVPVGEYFYRLRQTDRDNRFTYSKTVKVTVGIRTTMYRILNNPASSYVVLSLPAKRNATMINLVDVSGRMLMQKTIGAGTTSYRLEGIEQYSPGVYFIQIFSDTEKTVLKFVKK